MILVDAMTRWYDQTLPFTVCLIWFWYESMFSSSSGQLASKYTLGEGRSTYHDDIMCMYHEILNEAARERLNGSGVLYF